MKVIYLLSIAVIIFTLLGSCSVKNEPSEILSREADFFYRQSDHILERADLQEVVKYQNLRDAETLSSYFANEDPDIRARAAFAMASVQDSSVLQDLVALLNDKDEHVRMDAAFAIRQSYGRVEPGLLIDYFNKEESLRVKAMLLTSIGFNGNREDYDRVMSMSVSEPLELYQALCALYYLEHNDLVLQSGIDKMIMIMESGNKEVRETAAYLFYAMRRKSEVSADLADILRKEIETCSFDDVAAPYMLAYISCSPLPSDTSLYLNWCRNGEDLRARSFALDYMKYYSEYAVVRSELIRHLISPDYMSALAAAYSISECSSFSEEDFGMIERYTRSRDISFNIIPYLLNALWRSGDEEYVYSFLDEFPETEELELISAISGLKDIEFSRIESQVTKLLKSNNMQVALSTLEYLCVRLGEEGNMRIVELLSAFLSDSPHVRIKSDAVLLMAHHMKVTFTEELRRNLFLKYLEVFKHQHDDQSQAMCLVVLGDLQDEELRPLIQAYSASSNVILKSAAEGALSIMSLDPDKRRDVYKNEMLYSPTLAIDWDFLLGYGRFPRFKFQTSKGEIIVEVDSEQAPMNIQNIIEHIESGLMDSIHMYRVELNHVTQYGTLGHSEFRVLNEVTRITKTEGTCGVGTWGKDTGSQHLAITQQARPHNEGLYTVIGKVIKGQDIVRSADRFDMIFKCSVEPYHSPY